MIALAYLICSASGVSAEIDKTAIQQQINDRASQLDQINKQIQETGKTLKDTQSQRASLQRDLKVIDGTVANLNLGIQADDISNQQLQLEIEGLTGDLSDIGSSIIGKQLGVEESLRQIQKTGDQPTLALILGRDSLADGISDIQAFQNVQGQLSGDITSLQALRDEYQAKLKMSADKKGQIAFHQQDLKSKKLIIDDQKQERQQLLSQTKDKETVYQKQMNDLLVQQEKIAKEMEDLDRVLRLKIDPTKLPVARPGVLGYPVEDGQDLVTQGYGTTSFSKNGYKGQWHNGVDFGVPIGTPVLAAEDGVVIGVANEDLYCPRGAYGKFVAINHDNNLSTLYGHLSRQIVSNGDRVKRGQVIGYSGKTGYATGPHVHFGVYAQPTFSVAPSNSCGPLPRGGDLNPLNYL
jgi:murein DD-endopeptidase MepM/ murein hydrolase activator NlpD